MVGTSNQSVPESWPLILYNIQGGDINGYNILILTYVDIMI